jgi:alpha-D-ribose 1-methylphosphonate 5-triphosphate diphosphatase
MKRPERIFTNARLVLADEVVRGSIVIRDGVIASVDRGASTRPDAIDCEAALLIPGLVELHTDNVERHIQPRPGSVWPTEAAVLDHDRELAAAGITTVLNALRVETDQSSPRLGHLHAVRDALDAHRQSGALKIDHYFHWRCEVSSAGLRQLIEPLAAHPRSRLMSVMDHTPGQRQFTDLARYAEYYEKRFFLKGEELRRFVEDRLRDQRAFSAANRPYIVALAHTARVPLASHDDATASHVDEAVRDGVTVSEFPTTVEAAEASHRAGLHVLMGGPNVVRGKSHSGNVAALELARRGVLNILSSDYVPSSLLWGALLLHRKSGVSLPAAIATVTRNPARAVGFDDRGEIKPGLRGDLVLVQDAEGPPLMKAVWREGERVA